MAGEEGFGIRAAALMYGAALDASMVASIDARCALRCLLASARSNPSAYLD
jgi:hypothetical protein